MPPTSHDFEDGLKLVYNRALAMQKACEQYPSTMAAILGLKDKIVEEICHEINGKWWYLPTTIAQVSVVISGSKEAIKRRETRQRIVTDAGAKRRALQLPVGVAPSTLPYETNDSN